MICFLIPSNVKLTKSFFSEKSIGHITDCNNPLNHQRNSSQMSWGNTTVCRFLRGIWFHTQRKDEATISSSWSPQRKYYNDAQQKDESQGSLIRRRHKLLRICCWSFSRRYISSISVDYLPGQHTSNIDRSDKRKWLYTKKKKS